MIRTRICFVLLLFTPLAVYWQTIFSDYGMRDDYSVLREAREEPGKIVHFTASAGRPLYGALLETSFYGLDNVENLRWARLASVLLLTLVGLVFWRQLYLSGWNEIEAAAVGIGLTLLPAAQVAVGWAISWPQVLALLLSLAGFSAIETELERGGLKRLVALAGGCLIYGLAGLIYQSNAVFAVVPVAAVLLVRTGREPLLDLRWLGMHVGALVVGLGLSYGMTRLLFDSGIFQASARMQLETHPLGKLGWLLSQPLPNALALFVLRDDNNRGAVIFWLAALVTAGVIGFACRQEIRGGNLAVKRKWQICLGFVPWLAVVVSLVAAERAGGYRVFFALSGLVVLLFVYSLRRLLAAASVRPALQYAALGLLGFIAAVAANRNAYLLIAEPQGKEWETMQTAVLRAEATKPAKVFIVTPTAADRSTARIYRDEFGSLSSDSDWVPQEMFKNALHLRFPEKLPRDCDFTLVAGRLPPTGGGFNQVIDLRKFKDRPAP